MGKQSKGYCAAVTHPGTSITSASALGTCLAVRLLQLERVSYRTWMLLSEKFSISHQSGYISATEKLSLGEVTDSTSLVAKIGTALLTTSNTEFDTGFCSTDETTNIDARAYYPRSSVEQGRLCNADSKTDCKTKCLSALGTVTSGFSSSSESCNWDNTRSATQCIGSGSPHFGAGLSLTHFCDTHASHFQEPLCHAPFLVKEDASSSQGLWDATTLTEAQCQQAGPEWHRRFWYV